MASKYQIFVYGTLSFSEILSALLGRKVVGIPAKISGYKRIRVKDKVYPGLIAFDGEVEGVFHEQLSKEEVALLDAFEDDFYERIAAVVTSPKGEGITASTYIIPKENLAFATDELWDRNAFAKRYLGKYSDMVRQYRENYLKGHLKSQDFSN